MPEELFELVDENESNEETVEEKEQVVIEIPEAYQIRTTVNGREEIIDTMSVDKKRGIVPILKAKSKVRLLKLNNPDKNYFLVEIVHRIILTV